MKANKIKVFTDLLEKNRRIFKVPVYQRNYDWTYIQCKKLFDDIMNASNEDKQHFIGTIVYITDVDGGSGLDEVLIIDGQQRITTIYILLKAIFDLSKSNNCVSVESEINDVIFNRSCGEKYKIKLKPIKSDNEQLIYLMEDKFDKIDKSLNIYKTYDEYKTIINTELEKGKELRDILYGIKKLEVVEVILSKLEGDEPQKIFESINSTGLDLSLADLIRNYLLMDEKRQEEFYDEYWMDIEKNVGYKNMEDFFINYLNSETRRVVNSKNAYDLFKEICEESKLEHEDILKRLKRFSKYYGTYMGQLGFYSSKINETLSRFEFIKQSTALPFIFKVFDDFENVIIDETTLCNVLNYLLTYYIRMSICENNKNQNKFMKVLYSRVYGDGYEDYYEKFVRFLNNGKSNYRMPGDVEFKEALKIKPLYNKKNICKYVLSSIENMSKEKVNIEKLTIEHILPRKENSAIWKKDLGEDYSKVYATYLHTLGNLTITGYNSELGTRTFNDKKIIIRKNSKANILNKDILESEKWTEKEIVNRANRLSDILIDIFKYVDYGATEENDLYYTLDSDFTNSKPKGFEFNGEYTSVKSWQEFLKKAITSIYDGNSKVIGKNINEEYLATNVYITRNKGKLRNYNEIYETGIFYETNLSANAITKMIRELLNYMEIDSNDFKIYLV